MSPIGIAGRLLLNAGLVDETGLTRALDSQRREGGTLNGALTRLGLADPERVAVALAEGLRLAHGGSDITMQADVTDLLPAAFCLERFVAPLAISGDALRVAMVDPLTYATIQDVEFRTGRRVMPVVVSEATVLALLKASARQPDGDYDRATAVNPAGEIEGVTVEDNAKGGGLAPVVKLVNLLVSDAARAVASDVYFEPQDDHQQVRYRVDGMLQDVMRIRHDLQAPVLSRLKIVAGMDIAERRKPQDGRSTLKLDGQRIDLRISSLPTQFGEKVVVRLLDSRKAQLDLTRTTTLDRKSTRLNSSH